MSAPVAARTQPAKKKEAKVAAEAKAKAAELEKAKAAKTKPPADKLKKLEEVKNRP